MSGYEHENHFRNILQKFYEEKKLGSDRRVRSEKTVNAYKHRFDKFINEYLTLPENKSKRLDKIVASDVNVFISGLEKDKNNYYRALSSFFGYTYRNRETDDIKKDFINPNVAIQETKAISEIDCNKIVAFIRNKGNKLNDRLAIGLAYYTGLSTSQIVALTHGNILGESCLELCISDKQIPIHKDLQDILSENKKHEERKKKTQKEEAANIHPKTRILKISNQSTLGKKLGDLSHRITGTRYTGRPFEISFMQRALRENCNPYFVSILNLKSVPSIAKHISNDVIYGELEKIVDRI